MGNLFSSSPNSASEELVGDSSHSSKATCGLHQLGSFHPANAVEHGLLPSVKLFLKEIFMSKFLKHIYEEEIAIMLKTQSKLMSWSAVSRFSSTESPPELNKEREEQYPDADAMNVAMPDKSAEYWMSFFPEGLAPIFLFSFPKWALYAALTLYDTHGMPLASINMKQAQYFQEHASCLEREGIVGRSFIMRANQDRLIVNLLKDSAYEGPVCAIFRVYRPRGVPVTPVQDLPIVYTINREEVSTFNKDTSRMHQLRTQDRTQAFIAGARISQSFQTLVHNYMKELQNYQMGTQFFHPSHVAGLFVNADATYVVAFCPPDKLGMKIMASVPQLADYRCYYGVMAVDYRTTKTLASLTFDELGGWGAEYTLFVSRREIDACRVGYNSNDSTHKLLLWGLDAEGPLGVALRYIHCFHTMTGVEDEQQVQKEFALAEREGLLERNGDSDSHFKHVEGLGHIIYF